MRFKEVKTYQSVRFGKGEDNFFSLSKRGQEDYLMESIEWGIRIRSASVGEDIIISFNNVAYAKMVEDQSLQTKSSSKKIF